MFNHSWTLYPIEYCYPVLICSLYGNLSIDSATVSLYNSIPWMLWTISGVTTSFKWIKGLTSFVLLQSHQNTVNYYFNMIILYRFCTWVFATLSLDPRSIHELYILFVRSLYLEYLIFPGQLFTVPDILISISKSPSKPMSFRNTVHIFWYYTILRNRLIAMNAMSLRFCTWRTMRRLRLSWLWLLILIYQIRTNVMGFGAVWTPMHIAK